MSQRAPGGSRRIDRDRLRARRPRLESLEDRRLLAAHVVINTSNAGAGSLRQAILDANADATTPDVIQFNIAGSGFQIIAPTEPLPSLDRAMTIDGYSQPGAVANTAAIGTNAAIGIMLNGANIAAGSRVGLLVNKPGVTIRGLDLVGFDQAAIADTPTGGGALIAGNFVGTDIAGSNALPNGVGVLLQTAGNTIGGAIADLNLISGNSTGVGLSGNPTSAASANLVAGNLIGTSSGGAGALPNNVGVLISTATVGGTASANTIGGLSIAARNVIGSNRGAGVQILGAGASGNVVAGNYVGEAATGVLTVGNNLGIQISARNNTVGGTAAGARNVISGNTTAGVQVDNSAIANASGNAILGNFIGTNIGANSAQPNLDGVRIIASPGNFVGGAAAGAGNVISGNTNDGVLIQGLLSTGNSVAGNFVGTDSAGGAAVPNAVGVEVRDGASNTVGGTSPGARNIVSGNAGTNVLIDVTAGSVTATGNVVLGNFIGTDAGGTKALSASATGVALGGPGDIIGGSATGAGNLISGNQVGVLVTAGGTLGLIQGNLIGTDLTGAVALANSAGGVVVSSGSGLTIGGATAGARNVLSGNGGPGLLLNGPSTRTTVLGNYIGVDRTGNVALGNGVLVDGVLLAGSSQNTIGGAAPGAGNVISGNAGSGIHLQAGATGNVIQGNLVGVNAAGTAAVPNAGDGVQDNESTNTIGGPAAGAGNVLSGNGGSGVAVTSLTTSLAGTLIAGNFIGTDVTGKLAIGNASGVTIDGAVGATVGGTAAAARNVISGNSAQGLLIQSQIQATTGIVVLGNFIGTDATGAAALPNGAEGVVVAAPGNTIGGGSAGSRNVISGNGTSGVWVQSGGVTTLIAGNFIGLAADGVAPLGNGLVGVQVSEADVTIGGSAAGRGNVISANLSDGVLLRALASRAVLLGNFIGTAADGVTPRGNLASGVESQSAVGTTIGGAAGSARNVISANALNGVYFSRQGNSLGAVVQNNAIGTDLSGAAAIGNGLWGVEVALPGGVVIGGPTADLGNVIANNGPADPAVRGGGVGIGVRNVSSPFNDPVTVEFNSIRDNIGLGIDLNEDGATPNTPGSPHSGPNDLISFPVLSAAVSGATSTTIIGTLISTPNATFTLQFFTNATADPSGFGEGDQFLGSGTVTTNGGGFGLFTIVLPVTIPSGQFLSAVAIDEAGNTSEFSQILAAGLAADVSVTLAAAPSPVLLGNDLTYTMTVTNSGPSDASGVVATNTLPAGATFVSFDSSPPGVALSRVDQVITATIGDLAAGASVTITIVVTPQASGPITDNATVESDVADPVPANNSASLLTNVSPSTDLQVGLAASAPAQQGQPLTYTVTITNNGPSDATDLRVLDTLPGGVTFSSFAAPPGMTIAAPPPGTILPPAGATLTATFPLLAAGATTSFTIVIIPNKPGSITDKATVSGAETDPVSGNNTATLTTAVSTVTDLAVTVVDSPDPVFVGQLLTYVVTVTNNGPGDATGVIATDTLPAGVDFVGVLSQSQGTSNPSGGVVTLDFGDLPLGQSATATIQGRVTTAAAATSTDVAGVSGNEIDLVPANNSATADTTVLPSADLSLAIAVAPDPALVGTSLSYTITVTNNGPSDASGVTITDALPAGLAVATITPGPGGAFSQAGNVVTATFPTIAGGATATLTILVTPGPTAAGAVANTATVAAATHDPDATNNSATATSAVSPSADVSLSASGGPDPVLIGGNVTYVLVVTNHGPSPATNVTLTDTLPAGVTLSGSSLPPGASLDPLVGRVATVRLGTLASGASASVTLIVRTTAAGTIENDASVVAAETDPIPANGSTQTITQVTPAADLGVTISAGASTVLIGQPLTLTANVVNLGPSAASGVVFTAVLPPDLPIVAAVATIGTASVSGNLITVSVGALAAGGLSTITINTLPTALGVIQATALVDSSTVDGDAGNDTASAFTNVIPAADLAVTQVASADPAPLNGSLTYTLNVTNRGPSVATGVTLTDVLPQGAAFVSATAQDGRTFSPVGSVLTFPLGALAVGQGVSLSIVVSPTASGTLNNTASVKSDQADPVATNSTGVRLVTAVGNPGSLQFGASSYSVDENAGTATIAVTRTGGTDGPVTVTVSTSDGTGVAGTHYTPTSVTLAFAAGQTSQSFAVPVLDDGRNDGDKTVLLTLTNASGGASLGASSSAVLTIRNTDTNPIVPVNQVAPQLTNLVRFGFHTQPTELVLTFSGPLDPASAVSLSNYIVAAPDGRTAVPIASARYDATSSTVTLLMARTIDVHKTYHLLINGQTGGLTGSNGLLIDGDRNNQPGGNSITPINFATLAGPSPTTHPARVARHKTAAKAVAGHVATHRVKARWADHLTNRRAGR